MRHWMVLPRSVRDRRGPRLQDNRDHPEVSDAAHRKPLDVIKVPRLPDRETLRIWPNTCDVKTAGTYFDNAADLRIKLLVPTASTKRRALIPTTMGVAEGGPFCLMPLSRLKAYSTSNYLGRPEYEVTPRVVDGTLCGFCMQPF